jgi:hypothetical protein
MDGCDHDRYKNGDQCRNQEEVPLHINVFAEVFKPPFDNYIGNGPADQIGD